MKPANPFRYLIKCSQGELLNPGERLNHDQLHKFGIDCLGDLDIMGKDFYLAHTEPGDVLLTPIPGNYASGPERDIEKQNPPISTLDTHKVNDDFSLCWERDKLPEFDDLLRSERLLGGYQTDFDGFTESAIIPIARSPVESTLPKAFCFDANGAPVEKIENPYVYLWDIATTYFDAYSGQTEKLNEAEKLELAIKVLGANYRIGKTEVNAFFQNNRVILNTFNVERIMMNLIDAQNLPPSDDAKKN